MALDQQVLRYLKDTEFTRQQCGNGILFHNKADGDLQRARLYFISSYNNIEESSKAHALVNFYIDALSDGTTRCPTMDLISRDNILKGLHFETPNATKIQNRLMFTLPITMQGEKALGGIIETADEILETSLLLNPKNTSDVLEKVRAQKLKVLEKGISNHQKMSMMKEQNIFLPSYTPLTHQDNISIVKNATFSEMQQAFNDLISRSFPVASLSGNMDPENFMAATSDFILEYGGNGTEEVLRRPQVYKMSETTNPHHAYGPSEQIQFLRSYPLIETPENPKEELALECANNILGNGWTGKLMQVIREKHHLVYGIRSSYVKSQDRLFINTEHAPDTYGQIESLTRELVEDFARGNFTREEFDHQKNELLESLVTEKGRLGCEHPKFRILSAQRQLITQTSPMPLADKYRLLSEVTYNDAQEAVEKFIDSEQNQIFTYSNREWNNGA